MSEINQQAEYSQADSLEQAIERLDAGESLETIRQRGFGRADPIHPNYDPEPWAPEDPFYIENRTIDWDSLDEARDSRSGGTCFSA